ncbi:hypothetical protein FRC04_006116 [Tulasnella sp. 424]|nr:hypothetical protein FRC04_006116 [Tulasnella sp. 424]KAG8961343.1 hypothetical protein FRC05_006245 [Tulasnella sp. 425]
MIRSCHLIPAFCFGLTKDLLPASDFHDDPEDGDFVNYYVNQFVDRDMLMQFIGCGVGHAGMVDATYAPGTVQQILNIALSSKTDETFEAIQSLPEGRRQLAGDEEVLLESESEDGVSDLEATGSDKDSEMDVDDNDRDAASLEDYEY